MPRLSPAGKALHGIDGPLYYEGVKIWDGPAGGTWDFINETTIGGQACHDVARDFWHVESRGISGAFRSFLTPAGNANTGANRVRGGAGLSWWLDGRGYLDTEGRHFPAGEVLDRSTDGYVLLKLDRQVGDSVHVMAPTGQLIRRPADHASVAAGGGATGRWPLDGGYEVLWLDPYGLVIRAVGQPNYGHVLSADEHNYNYAIRVVGDVIHVVSSFTTGEALATDLRRYQRLVTDPMVRLGNAPPVPEPPTEPPSMSTVLVQAFPHNCLVSAFYGNRDDLIGNAETVVESEGDLEQIHHDLALPVVGGARIVQGDTQILSAAELNPALALWASDRTVAGLGPKIEVCRRQPLARATIAYADTERFGPHRPDWYGRDVWPSIQMYRYPGQPLNDFVDRVERELVDVRGWSDEIAFTLRMDVWKGGDQVPVSHTLACVPHYLHWIREQRPFAIQMFADTRGGGMMDHPELRLWGQLIAHAVPGRISRRDGWDRGAPIDEIIKEIMARDAGMYWLSPRLRARIVDALDAAAPPVPVPIEIPNQLDLVRRVRARYHEPPLTDEEAGHVVNAIAWELKATVHPDFGLSVKPGGNNVPAPHGDGIRISYDTVQLAGTTRLWDCLTGEPVRCGPAWGSSPYHNDPDGRPWLGPIAPRLL